MNELIEQCLADESSPAWGELWQVFCEVAGGPIRRQLLRAGFRPVIADEVVNESFEILWENRSKRLHSCRAETEPEFHAWLRSVAISFARDWSRSYFRARRREKIDRNRVAHRADDGPTEAHVEAALDDLEGAMSHEKIDRLRKLSGLLPDADVPDRTRRQWKHDLEPEVARQLGLARNRKRRSTSRKKSEKS